MFNQGPESNTPWAVRMLLKAGLQNEKQAQAALVVIVVLCFLFAFIMFPTKDATLPNDPLQNPNYIPE